MSRHAYLILAHSDIPLFRTLLALLDDPRNDIFIHIDQSVDARLFEIAVAQVPQTSRTILVDRRHRVSWGAFSMIEAELTLLEAALSEGPYDYYHLLSGTDLPLKSPDEIHHFFGEHQGTEFVDFWPTDRQKMARYQARYQYYEWFQPKARHRMARGFYHMICAVTVGVQRLLRVDREAGYPHRASIGSQWFSITDELARIVVSSAQEIRSRFRHTKIPDEAVLQTVVWESPFADRLAAPPGSGPFKTLRRAILFEQGRPRVWLRSDVSSLLGSGMLFARKFSSSVDTEAIRTVAEAVRRNRKTQTTTLQSSPDFQSGRGD